MPSPHASVSEPRSTVPAGAGCGGRLVGDLGFVLELPARALRVRRLSGPGVVEAGALAACLLRRTAPRDGRRPTSAGSDSDAGGGGADAGAAGLLGCCGGGSRR